MDILTAVIVALTLVSAGILLVVCAVQRVTIRTLTGVIRDLHEELRGSYARAERPNNRTMHSIRKKG